MKSILALNIVVLSSLALPAFATSIPIANADFNAQVLGANTFALGVTDWPGGSQPGNGAAVVSDQRLTFPAATLPPGGGPNVAILGDFNGGTGFIFQVLPTAWAADTTYTLSFYVGRGANLTYEGYLVTLDGGSTNSAVPGPTLLATDNNTITGFAAGTWVQDTLTYTTGDVAPSGDITIELGLTAAGGGTGYDLITLDAVSAVTQTGSAPEPGTWMMFAAGLLVIGAGRACVRAR